VTAGLAEMSRVPAAEKSSNPVTSAGRSPLTFFILLFLLSVPFWLIRAVTNREVLPGLPMSSFMWVCPVLAAAMLVYGEEKAAGVIELLSRSFDYQRIRAKVWYAALVLLMPGVTVLAYGLMRVVGRPLPIPQFPGLAALALFFLLFIPVGRQARQTARILLALLQQGLAYVVAVAAPGLVGVHRAHAVARIIEDQPLEQ
jgi:hypothetical protein